MHMVNMLMYDEKVDRLAHSKTFLLHGSIRYYYNRHHFNLWWR
jgi:hypothetical protein